mmetsp:Transcript_165149/g.292464  ORF Transcript_165149/g.292464 Transcript_165149/m.292464 type:complete len:296 (-) Transcript_165149:66-953(-)
MGTSIACATGVVAVLTCGTLTARARLAGKRADASDGVKPCKKILYLVRHGEACHNVAEKLSRRGSLKIAEQSGIPEHSPSFKDIAEKQRKKVLKSAEFKDAKLSNDGIEQANGAQRVVCKLQDEGLPEPSIIFVSPLQRTLKTAQVIFQDHPNVHVREELRERVTGLPCDEPSPQSVMQKRTSFISFKWDETPQRMSSKSSINSSVSSSVEDKDQLRERTTWALDSLLDTEHYSIGIVSHKGFLRELERGPLQREDAPEFDNCEVRVYEVTRDAAGSYEAKSLHGGVAGLDGCGN